MHAGKTSEAGGGGGLKAPPSDRLGLNKNLTIHKLE